MENYQSGGRTRNIINIANVGGGGTAAYSLTAANSAPSTAADGYENWGLQGNLHVAIGYSGGSGTPTFIIWGYHSFTEDWGVVSVIDPADGGNNAVTLSVANNTKIYSIIPIKGIERIAVQCTGWGTGGAASVYLGVNTL
mgnify:CR=1 FL=1|tara:strand:- start:1741 stop:2160 length:420 start_codon:yes stop_codon:yes gene_type:complete